MTLESVTATPAKLRRDVTELSALIHGARPCPECGGEKNSDYEVVFDESGGPEWCPACGRQLAFVITWGDGSERY